MVMDVLSYGIGTLVGFAAIIGLVFVFISDITQKKHGVLRNYPVVGRLRYFFEELGEYFRQYFFAGDRDEMPFNRSTRGWVYRLAKNEGGVIGFGSTYDLHQSGALIFVNHPFPVLEEERLPTPACVMGEGYARYPFEARSIVNISGMSFGAISAPAVRSLSRGAAVAGCWMDTGEGGLSPYHLEGGGDIIMQIGTAKYGLRDAQGNLSPDRPPRQLAQVHHLVEQLVHVGDVVVAVGADRVLAHRDAADAGDLLRDLAARQHAALARLGALGQFDLERLHEMAQLFHFFRREAAVVVAHAVLGGAHLHDDVAAAPQVMRRKPSLTGAHPAAGFPRAA